MAPNVETFTSGDDLYRRMLLQEILSEIRDIKKEQKLQGKDIARLQVRTGVIATGFGLLAGLIAASVKGIIAKVVGNG